MKITPRLTRGLRAIAIVALAAALGTWVATGAHVGWTQTSAVTLEHDEITGIDYPVRRAAFIAGVEVPFLGLEVAASLGGLSLLPQRRQTART